MFSGGHGRSRVGAEGFARVIVGDGPHWGEVVRSCWEVGWMPACMRGGLRATTNVPRRGRPLSAAS